GYDATFCVLPPSDSRAEAARRLLGAAPSDSLYKVMVHDYASGKELDYIVSTPFTNTHQRPVGRGTRCFRAYDCADGELVLLKDTWRISTFTPERETYAYLKRRGVKCIPDVLAAGDVSGQECGVDGGGIQRLVHSRLVLKQVGVPLAKFRSTWELVNAVAYAFQAHCEAFRHGVLHRDVSAGNILIDRENNQGFLIDWEMAMKVTDNDAQAYERTGTWQFRSIRLLMDPSIPHGLRDDIESFVHVLYWTAVKYAPS
ncbi:hypothetical protein CONPUDRAFT_25041, partial [Coniophora puteana RWD-64-598 SS2]